MEIRKHIITKIIATFLCLIFLFPGQGFSYNKSWDQGHDSLQPNNGQENWGEDTEGENSPKECCVSDCKMCPVYANNGRLQRSFTDLTLPGVGPALIITRTYLSQEWSSSLLGHGWMFNFGKRVIVGRSKTGEKLVVVRQDTGEKNFYKEDTNGNLELLAGYGVNYEFTKIDSGYCLAYKGGLRYDLQEDGKITKITDKNSNSLIFEYNSVGCLSRITNASGNYVDFQMGPNGKIVSVSDNLGRTINYNYDQKGNLIASIDPLGNATQYIYDSQNRLIEVIDPRGNKVFSVTYTGTQPPKVATFFETGESYSMQYYNNYTVKTDSQGNAWIYYFNDLGIIEQVVDPLGNVTKQLHNKITSTSMDWQEDANGHRSTFTYDEDGNVLTKTDALGNTWTYTYIGDTNWVETESDPKGVVTKNEYDSRGNLIKIIRDFGGILENVTTYTYDSKGNRTSVTDSLGHKTTYEYDTNGNVLKIINPAGDTETYTYDLRGNCLTNTDANGNTTVYTYDLMGRLIAIKDALGNSTVLTYDANGNFTSQTNAAGDIKTFSYDIYNRLSMETDALGNNFLFNYDSRGNLISLTDANGNTTTFDYDVLNRLIREANALGGQINYKYDGAGNILTLIDAQGNKYVFTYDSLNRPITAINPLGYTVRHFYDENSNLIKKIDASDNQIIYEYDRLNRLIKITYPDNKTESFAFDSLGNLINWNNGVFGATYSYDILNRVVAETTTYPFGEKTVSYGYDKAGNITVFTFPDTLEKVYYTYDSTNRLISVQGGLFSGQYQYDNVGRLIKKTLSNNNYTEYLYDKVGRLISLVNKHGDNSVISSFTYVFDKVGNRLSRTSVFEGQPTASVEQYTYDNIYRLIESKKDNIINEAYSYDSAGNRKTSLSQNNWDYDAANRLLTCGGYSFTYDNNGNMLTKSDGTNSQVCVWDYQNKLSQITGNNYQESYQYDPFGRRISKTFGGNTIYYVYDKEDIIAECDSTGNIIRRYIHGLGIDEPLWVMNAGQPNGYYYTFDGLGSVSELTDDVGSIQEKYGYTAFGETTIRDAQDNIISASTVGNPYAYTSREYDAKSALYFNRARYYDAGLGRFITADPIGFKGGANFYSYCSNNPINLVDPYGQQGEAVIVLLPSVTPPGWVVWAVVGTVFIAGALYYLLFASRLRAHNDPYSLPRVNPGRDCNGKCNPCPPNGPVWEHQHRDGTVNRHQIIYRQNPVTCECFPERIHL